MSCYDCSILYCPRCLRLPSSCFIFAFDTSAPTELSTLSLHDALPIFFMPELLSSKSGLTRTATGGRRPSPTANSMTRFSRSEEHTSELQSRGHLVCRLLLEKKKQSRKTVIGHNERG